MTRLWVWQEASDTYAARTRAQHEGQFRLLSGHQLEDALVAFYASLPGDRPWPDQLPADFPVPRLRLPDTGFAPDYVERGSWRFASARLRAAMALPDRAVDYRPAVIEEGSRQAHDQDYALMYVRAFAAAIDLETSDLGWRRIISHKTGNPVISVSGISQIRVRPDLDVPADLFKDANATIVLLATDALAERVMAAGCTGVWFVHPLWLISPDSSYVIRTAEGFAKVTWFEDRDDTEIRPIAADVADAGPDMPPRGV